MGAMKYEKLVSIERIKLAFHMLDIVLLKIYLIRMEMVIYQKKNWKIVWDF